MPVILFIQSEQRPPTAASSSQAGRQTPSGLACVLRREDAGGQDSSRLRRSSLTRRRFIIEIAQGNAVPTNAFSYLVRPLYEPAEVIHAGCKLPELFVVPVKVITLRLRELSRVVVVGIVVIQPFAVAPIKSLQLGIACGEYVMVPLRFGVLLSEQAEHFFVIVLCHCLGYLPTVLLHELKDLPSQLGPFPGPVHAAS